jgi:N-acetylmuramoyl-L-alanine amidase
LAKAGIGHWVAPAPISAGVSYGLGDEGQPIRALQALLSVYGYDLTMTGVYDEATKRVVEAFQRHFRPALVDGRADLSTLQTLRDLVAALPGV